MDSVWHASLQAEPEHRLRHVWPSVDGVPICAALSGAAQIYDGALNTVGIDVGVIGAVGLAWAVLAPSSGISAGALVGGYVGACGDLALGAGLGANVLIGGSQRSFALQPFRSKDRLRWM